MLACSSLSSSGSALAVRTLADDSVRRSRGMFRFVSFVIPCALVSSSFSRALAAWARSRAASCVLETE